MLTIENLNKEQTTLAWDTTKESQLRSVVAETLEIEEDDVTEATSPENTASWDSLMHLNLMSAVEERFGIQMTMDEMGAVKSVKDIRAILERY